MLDPGELHPDDPFFAAKSALRERSGANDRQIAELTDRISDLTNLVAQLAQNQRNQQSGSQSEQQ